MTKSYEEIDIDTKVFFNTICIPVVFGVVFGSLYSIFVISSLMIFLYEFILLDEFNEIYTKEEIEVKRDSLFLTYVMYAIFLFIFWQDIVNYIKG